MNVSQETAAGLLVGVLPHLCTAVLKYYLHVLYFH